jgi:hypothetical protein
MNLNAPTVRENCSCIYSKRHLVRARTRNLPMAVLWLMPNVTTT